MQSPTYRGLVRPLNRWSVVKTFRRWSLGASFLLSAASAWTQSAPTTADAVQVSTANAAFSESISGPIVPSSIPAPVREPDAIPEAPGSTEVQSGERVLIHDVRLVGNTLFTETELSSLVRADLGRALSFGELQAFASRIQKYYHDQGYLLARVIIPKQELGQERILELRVLEGHLGQVEVTGNRRMKADRIARSVASEVTQGEAFRIRDLERAILRLNGLSGMSVSSTLKAGTELGSTDLEVNVQEDRRVTGSVEINNFGNENTGLLRVVPTLSFPNLLGRGDVASIFGVFSPEENNLYFGQASYSTPIGYRGFSASGYYSAGNYQVGQEFAALAIEGDNSSAGIGLSYEYIRSTRTVFTFEGWLEASDMEQTMLRTTSSEDKIRKLRFGLNLDHRGLRGRSFASLHIHQGLGEVLGAMENDSRLSSRSFGHADNSFTKIVGSFTRLQSLHPRLFLVGHLTAQYAVDSVVAGEQIFIGGANSVRGHPQSAFSGDDGLVLNVEARYSIFPDNNRYQLAVFADHGEAHTKKPVLGQEAWSRISGAGFGGRATLFDNLELRADLGVPLGEKSGADVYLYAQMRYRF